MKGVRVLTVYYRDKDGIMRSIPKVKVRTIDGRPDKVYTLYPQKEQELILK
jgi:phage I-like protein